jgi:hypothetical protein
MSSEFAVVDDWKATSGPICEKPQDIMAYRVPDVGRRGIGHDRSDRYRRGPALYRGESGTALRYQLDKCLASTNE